MTHYHIVGIAGAGMSAIAHVLLDQGHVISGSDLQRSNLGDALIARGATIYQSHAAEHIAGADALVVTSAVQLDHVELQAARAHGIPIMKRADLWAAWSRVRSIVAVAGTHGKTTTTAMIALILTHAGLDPGFLIGGDAPDLGTNARWGDPNAVLVIEADEYDRTFLAITAQIAVITNVEWDHVDSYPSQESYAAAFHQFAASVTTPRNIIVCGDDGGALRAINQPDATYYGIDQMIASDPASCRLAALDWIAANLQIEPDRTLFDIWRYDRSSFAMRLAGKQQLCLPGTHNVRNALAALATCTALGVPLAVIIEGLARYHGVARRFELKGELAEMTVIDDYAHHPTEVRATITAAHERYQGRRVLVYLQPHTYSRTKALLPDWPAAFDATDLVLVGDIYAAREHDRLGMSAERLAAAIGSQAIAVGGIDEAVVQILARLQPHDVLLTLGAGDSYRVGELVLEQLRRGHHE